MVFNLHKNDMVTAICTLATFNLHSIQKQSYMVPFNLGNKTKSLTKYI